MLFLGFYLGSFFCFVLFFLLSGPVTEYKKTHESKYISEYSEETKKDLVC